MKETVACFACITGWVICMGMIMAWSTFPIPSNIEPSKALQVPWVADTMLEMHGHFKWATLQITILWAMLGYLAFRVLTHKRTQRDAKA